MLLLFSSSILSLGTGLGTDLEGPCSPLKVRRSWGTWRLVISVWSWCILVLPGEMWGYTVWVSASPRRVPDVRWPRLPLWYLTVWSCLLLTCKPSETAFSWEHGKHVGHFMYATHLFPSYPKFFSCPGHHVPPSLPALLHVQALLTPRFHLQKMHLTHLGFNPSAPECLSLSSPPFFFSFFHPFLSSLSSLLLFPSLFLLSLFLEPEFSICIFFLFICSHLFPASLLPCHPTVSCLLPHQIVLSNLSLYNSAVPRSPHPFLTVSLGLSLSICPRNTERKESAAVA